MANRCANEQAESWNSDREIAQVIVLDKAFHEGFIRYCSTVRRTTLPSNTLQLS